MTSGLIVGCLLAYATISCAQANVKVTGAEDAEIVPKNEILVPASRTSLPTNNFRLDFINKVLAPAIDQPEARSFQRLPRSCAESRTQGAQLIQVPYSGVNSFLVYCDAQTQLGNWTVIQRRVDGSTDFLRGWSEYKNGFGNVDGELFIGLEKLHLLTNYEKQELLIVMEDFDNVVKYAHYDEFEIGDERDEYSLRVLGTYTGTAGDALDYHRGQKFSTYDHDNDQSDKNCAKLYKAGWWFKGCLYSNLNGLYLHGNYGGSNGRGTNWYYFKNTLYYSLKSVQMMIRPIQQ